VNEHRVGTVHIPGQPPPSVRSETAPFHGAFAVRPAVYGGLSGGAFPVSPAPFHGASLSRLQARGVAKASEGSPAEGG
jgi:hypothetical protein